MFKSSRWRSEKNKIKVIFKLQFQATQVPQLGKDTLMVSLVPVEVGRPTVRLEKAAIRDGTCRWENPIYETVKFVQETKTGKVNEKIYQFIVATGSSKAGVLGEVTIDFADYFEAIKPSNVSLPLKTSNSGTVLHVMIQRMHGDVDQKYGEENGDTAVNFDDRSLRSKMSNGDTDENSNCNSIEAGSFNKNTIQNVEPNGNLLVSKGSDVTSASGSESNSERGTPRELGVKNNNIQRDNTSLLSPLSQSSMPQKPTADAITTNGQEHRRSSTEWSVGSAPDMSVDGLTNGLEDNLKHDLLVLARQAEVSELELQTLRKQIVKESKRGQDLAREVLDLKDERDALKKECEQLKASQKRGDVSSKLQFESGDPRTLLQEIRQELNYEKDLNTNLRIQLQKTQDSNSELILAVQDLDEMLEQKNKEISYLSNKSASNENEDKRHETISKHETDDDEEQQALELIVREHNDTRETYLLEQKIIDLYNEIEIYRRDRDELEMQMEQLALDYEILKQENHDIMAKLEQNYLQEQLKASYDCSASFPSANELETQVESLEKELKEQKEAYSASLGTINELQSQVKWLEKDIEEQTQGFETKVESLEKELKEQKEEYSASLGTINELQSQVKWLEKELEKQAEGFETQVESLEKELKEQKEDHSLSLGTIKELQSQVKWLEEELENQVQGFETDLEAVTHAKVEQEQRAIQAEEALRKTRWSNASTAGRLQEEFRRLSMQMASTFDANEKLTTKAVTEANELRLQKSNLEEMLEKANEEIGLVREQYEKQLKELSDQIDMETKKAEQMLLELEDKSKRLEDQQKREEEMHEAFSKEILVLGAELEKLRGESSQQEEQKEELRLEMEKLKLSVHESELLVQRGNVERDELERKICSVKKEAEKALEELNNLRAVKDEKERMVGNLQPELEALSTQYNDLKHSLFEDELEKESLRKQVFDLKIDLKKKEDKISSMEKKLKESGGRITVFDAPKSNSRNNKSAPVPRGSKEVACLKEKIKLLEGQIKQKEAALENSNNSFLEKERDLSCKIEELENRMVELSQNTTSCEDQFRKELKDATNMTENDSGYGGTGIAENFSSTVVGTKACLSHPIGTDAAPIRSSNGTCPIVSTSPNCDQGRLDELLSEMSLLKTRNQTMEGELKDMQERYSEISLKFAEVEGERQQLVMTVRNLRRN